MKLNAQFDEFNANIRLTDAQEKAFQREHKQLRDGLHGEKSVDPYLVDSFLQGSYRRSTIVKPVGTKRPDLDIIAVTKFDKRDADPRRAIDAFAPFLRSVYGNVAEQSHSLRVESGGVQIDLVVAAAPSEAEQGLLKEAFGGNATLENPALFKQYMATVNKAFSRTGGAWKFSPLEIPDRDLRVWEPTHPIAQIEWTQAKNARCGGHFLSVVRGVKWWKASQCPPEPKRPKGYPLEHMIGQCCPDGISGTADGLTRTLESMVERYRPYAEQRQTPKLRDHGVNQDVLKRIDPNDFAHLYDLLTDAAGLARQAHDAEDEGDSVELWHQLMGDEFPHEQATVQARPRRSIGGGFQPPTQSARPRDARFA